MLFVLSACQSSPPAVTGVKIGKPYIIEGKTYYPEYDPTYDKIGEASWYGPGFHGRYTASGEVYNQNDLTAAHPTLPMPSLVRVTNLGNGRSLIVRVNDRGPFKRNRIIDLSKKAASELGIKGTQQVRVQFLKKDTEEYIASLDGTHGKRVIDMVAFNEQAASEKRSSILHATEPAKEPTEQIVESTVSNSRPGQVVNDAAPITTVQSDDLNPSAGTPEPSKEVKIYRKDEPSSGLIQQAYAADESAQALAKGVSADSIPSQPAAKKSKSAAQAPSDSATSSTFFIQAGSFSAEENARKLASKLEGIAALSVSNVVMGAKSWWRVRVGPLSDKSLADEALAKVRAFGSPDARIVYQ